MDFSYFSFCRNSDVEPLNCSWYCDCRIVNPVVFEKVGMQVNLNEISKKIF